jgi:hypothetical protein
MRGIQGNAVKKNRDEDRWEKAVKNEKLAKDTLRYIHQYFQKVVQLIRSERE